MSARAWIGIAVAPLLLAACGERVQIGDNDPIAVPPQPTSSPPDQPDPPDPPPDVCVNALCGQPCPLDTCVGMGCPPSTGGYCDPEGQCVLAMPECPDVDAECVGHPCGAPCPPPTPCMPGDPDCTVSTPPMQCDAFQQCQVGPVTCH